MLTVGYAMRGEVNPKEIWEVADMLVEARTNKEVGIKTVKRTRKAND
jgi:hypothetical protein